MNKKLKFEDLVPNNTVGIQKVTPTVANMPNAAQGNVSYTSLIKNDTINTGAPYSVGNFDVKIPTYTDATSTDIIENSETTTTDTVPKMSYEEWYNTAKNNAETTRQNAIGEAQVNYNKSKSEYGNRAESLRNMGLTGAGYSDYLNGQAYAQMQGAIANANAQKASTIADIDAKYMDYLEQKRAEKTNAYNSLYADVKDGAYSGSDIVRLVNQYGLDETQKQDLINAYLEGGTYTAKDLDVFFDPASSEYNTYYNDMINSINNVISDDMFATVDKATAYATYQELIKTIDAAIAREKDEGKKQTLEQSKQTLTNAYNNVHTNPVQVSSNVRFKSNRLGGVGEEGERFNLTSTDGEGKIVVEFTGAKLEGNAKSQAQNNPNITDGTVFKMGNNYYVRIGEEYYAFTQRNNRSGEWKAFTEAFGKTPET